MDDWAVMRHLRNDNGISWVCRHCDDPFPWDVHPDTIRHHLTEVCESVPEEVKEAAQRRVVEAGECSRSVEGSDSNFNAETEASRNAGMEVEATECSRSVNCEPMRILDASENNDGSFEAEMERSSVERRKKRRITEDAPLTKFLVGDALRRNVEKIWSWLMDDQVLRVGICGMGGVGKTTLMRYIQTRLKAQCSFEVYWITVSEDFSIWKLQDLIAKKIDLRFNDNEDEVERAEKLTESLEAKGKHVLILDDLWDNFDIDRVGIQVGVNTCKLVLTTRLLEVCRQMDCIEENTIQVQALSDEEAWILFTQELGSYSIEVEELGKAVCKECAGLPLGIRVMARSMKRNCNVRTWRNTLTELKGSKVSKGHKMEKVFSVLKFSYLQLPDPALRECLSYCALFPEDDKIDRNELVEYMIVEGIVDQRGRRQEESDKGHTMLEILENACLLEGDTRFVWMHDLIRDMVILELREGCETLVEAGAQLTKLPNVEKWTEKLVRVSLISNDIDKMIPSYPPPKCPNLSTLLLCRNHGLKMIADSFSEQFQKLKILDLSCCDEIEKLPDSIGDLVNLTALLVRYCWRLTYVPSLAKLLKLEKLDLSHCEMLEQMPRGVSLLLELKYLDLSGTGIKQGSNEILHMLFALQVLKLYSEYGHSDFSIRGHEVALLSMLETLYCIFSDVAEFQNYMKRRRTLSDYCILIQREYPYWKTSKYSRKLGSRKFVSVTSCSFTSCLKLPADIEALHIYDCSSTLYKRLFSLNLLESLRNLQDICVENWYDIEEIFAIENGGGRMEYPFYSDGSSGYRGSLSNLKLISIRECHKLKKLFPPSLLSNLHNLQHISVCFCKGIEEIFSTDQEEDGQELLSLYQPNMPILRLLRLTSLNLHDLPELSSVYKGAIRCDSLREIELVDCPKLERITLPLQQPSLQSIKAYPKKWWESLQWGSVDDKNRLESFCVFKK